MGVNKGRLVYVVGNWGRVNEYDHPGKDRLLEAHYNAIRKLIGPEGTIVVPSSSMNLVNTDIVFDLDTTPSERVGPFSEYVRKLPEARRSFHPFMSYTAVGPLARDLVDNVSRHAFGMETPQSRMVDLDALHVSIGLHPRLSSQIVHHLELVMGVPYRYVREYIQPVIRDGEVRSEPFYLYVCWLSSNVQKSKNRKIFERYLADHEIAETPLCSSKIYSHSVKTFYDAALKIFADDIYVWAADPPPTRPYQEMM